MKKAVIDEILKPGSDEKIYERERDVREKFWKKLKTTASKIPYLDEVIACYYCAMDPQTPMQVRGTILAALAYFIMPLDLLPDFLFGFGLTDDIAVLTMVISKIREHVTDSHRDAAQKVLNSDDLQHESKTKHGQDA